MRRKKKKGGQNIFQDLVELCKCPKCGITKTKSKKRPFIEELCPNCGTKMIMG